MWVHVLWGYGRVGARIVSNAMLAFYFLNRRHPSNYLSDPHRK